jgi:hypothetical protein
MIEMQNKNIKQYNVAGFPLFLLGCGPVFFWLRELPCTVLISPVPRWKNDDSLTHE